MAKKSGGKGRRLRSFVMAVLAFVVAVAVLVGFLGFTRAGSSVVLAAVRPLLASDGMNVSITNVSPLLTGHLTAQKVSLSDKNGRYAEIDGVVVDWSPLALLGLKFKASNVHADRISIERAPESSAAGGNSSSGGGLPVAIDIKALSLPHIMLAPSFSGKTETLSLDGSAAIDRNAAHVSAVVQDLGNSAANATVSFDYDLPGGALAVDVEASEPCNGLIAGLLGLPGKPALGVTVKGEGPLANWKGTASASVEGLPVVRFDAVLQKPASGPLQLSLKGGGAVDSILPPSVAPLFRGRTNVDLVASLDPDGKVSVQSGHIATDAVSIDMGGTLALSADNDFHAQLMPASGGASFAFGVSKGEARIGLGKTSITVRGPAARAKISASVALDDVALPQGRFRKVEISATSSAFDLKDRTGAVAADLSVGSATFENTALQRLVQAPLRISAPVEVAQDAINADFKLESGVASARGKLNYDLASKALKATFDAAARPAALPPAIGDKLTQAASLTGSVVLSDGNIILSGLKLSSQALTAEGSASLKASAVAADISGTLPDLSRLQRKAQGKGAFTIAASGTLDEPAAKITLSVPDAVLSGQKLADFKLTADGKLASGAGVSGDIRAAGSIAKQPIQVIATMRQTGQGGSDIPDLKVMAGKNTVSGALTFGSDFVPIGHLQFDLPDLPLLGAMAGQPVQGSAKGGLTARRGSSGKFAAKLDLTAAKMSLASVALSGVAVSLDYADAVLNGVVKASDIASGTQSIKNVSLSFSGDTGKTGFALKANYEGGPVSANGSIAPGDPATVLHLDNASAVLRKIAVKLAAPTDVKITNGSADLNDLTVAAGAGRVRLSGKAGAKLDLQARIENLPADIANNFSARLGAEGAISGSVKVSGKASDPVADFSLSWPKASLAATRSAGAPSLDIAAQGRYAAKSLDVTASASGGGVALKGGGKLGISGARAVSMRFSGSAPLSLGQAFVATAGIGLSGLANFDITVGGALPAPSISGTVKLASAGLEMPRENLKLTDIVGTLAFDGKTARIENLAGKFAGGGTFSAGGTVGIAQGSGFPADLSLKVVDQSYADGRLVTALVGGDLSIKGPLAGGAVIGGQVVVKRATITVPEKMPASIAAIKLEHKNAPQDVLEQAAELKGDTSGGHAGGSSAFGVALDITARNQIFVRGRGMDAELGGSLKVTGTTAAPIVSGGFEMIRGRLSILGKRLDFTSGKIGFGGGLVPNLNLDASTSSSSLAITVNVSGPANDPEFKFTSSPSRPQDEVLAQLVFGRSASSLSPLQIAQLADAVLQLSGGQSTSIFSKLRKNAGIDDLDVTTDSSGNAQVTAGKYLNDKTYLQLQQGAAAGTGKAIINLDAGKGIKLRGEADSNGEGAAGIFFEKEY